MMSLASRSERASRPGFVTTKAITGPKCCKRFAKAWPGAVRSCEALIGERHLE